MWGKASSLGLVLFIAAAAVAQESTESLRSCEVQLFDADGMPVDGAQVGTLGSIRMNDPKTTAEWRYSSPARSDATGAARVTEEYEGELENRWVLARHEGRKISAVANIAPTKLEEPIKLTLVPECIVTAEVTCSELAGKWPPGQVVHVRQGGKIVLVYVCKEFKIRLPLPPGEYEFEVLGDMTLELKRPVHVIAAQSQQLEPFDLPASNLGLIQGLPAPELADVVGWKNGPALKLADLRGKCVVLDFFGYWCGPCVHQMPAVMDVYEKYRDQGLVVIGVHTDLGDDEDEPVDTAEKLDERLAETRATLWKGRDIPFPAALLKCVRTRYRDDLPAFDKTARSATAARYGVMFYPTQILIDRQGNVVGTLDLHGEEGIALLEKTLRDK